MDPQSQPSSDSGSASREVAGWLLALCLIRTAVFPATSLYHIVSHTIPTTLAAHGLTRVVLLAVYSLLFSALAVLSFMAGLRLWLVRPHAVACARRFLLTYLIANAAYFIFWIAIVRPTTQVAYAEMGWYHVVAPAASAFLWYTYLETLQASAPDVSGAIGRVEVTSSQSGIVQRSRGLGFPNLLQAARVRQLAVRPSFLT